MAGHSQGVMACESLRAKGTKDAELLALLQLIGAAGSLVSRRRGMVGRGDKSPMVSVTNVDPDRMAELLEEFSKDVRTVLPPVLSIRNGRRSVVITGTPEQLGRFELYCSKITEKEEAERKNKIRGGAIFRPEFHGVQVEVGFHTPRLADGVEIVDRWAEKMRHRRPAGARDDRVTSSCGPSTGSVRSSGCTSPGRSGSSTSDRATPSRA